MCRRTASKRISGTVSAMTLASPGVMALPSRPSARFGGKCPLPRDRQRKYVRSTSTRQSRVRNEFPVAGCRRIGLPQLSHSGVGSMPSSCSRSSFSAAAPPPRERSRSARSTPSGSGRPDASSAASLGSCGQDSAGNGHQKRRKRLVLRDLQAPHFVALDPVPGLPDLVQPDHGCALLGQAYQIRHSVLMLMPAIPRVLRDGPRSLPRCLWMRVLRRFPRPSSDTHLRKCSKPDSQPSTNLGHTPPAFLKPRIDTSTSAMRLGQPG